MGPECSLHENLSVHDVRITIRVKPGTSRTRVGGRYGDNALIVAVEARPVDGAANEAVLDALAEALGVRPHRVHLVQGHTARTKVVTIETDDPDTLRERVRELLG